MYVLIHHLLTVIKLISIANTFLNVDALQAEFILLNVSIGYDACFKHCYILSNLFAISIISELNKGFPAI